MRFIRYTAILFGLSLVVIGVVAADTNILSSYIANIYPFLIFIGGGVASWGALSKDGLFRRQLELGLPKWRSAVPSQLIKINEVEIAKKVRTLGFTMLLLSVIALLMMTAALKADINPDHDRLFLTVIRVILFVATGSLFLLFFGRIIPVLIYFKNRSK